MATLLFILASVTLLGTLGFAVVTARGNRRLDFLADAAPLAWPRPRVSVIVTALNEERNIEEALRSVLAQDYGNFEVIAINDRSTDRTGEILDRLAQTNPALRVLHIRELPKEWLGKNHALWRGALQAGGELLLFTDADIVMDPSALSRAAGYMQRHGLDHLTSIPQPVGGSFMTRVMIGTFGMFFNLYAVPWQARNPRARWHTGIGAFNMVRREAYLASGTHQAIAMRPDDDMKLGKLIKRHGFRQDVVLGRRMLRVEWYATLGEVIRGLTKNAFAGVEYRVTTILGATAIQFFLFVWPFLGIFLTHGWTRLLNALAAAAIVLACRDTARFHDGKPWFGIFFPLSTLIFIYILWRSMVLTLARRGIEWRGTHYPLAKLKANRV